FPIKLDGDEQMAAVTDSYSEFMWGAYKAATLGNRFSRTIGAPTREVTTREMTKGFVDTVNETIDASVFNRWQRDEKYRPPPLEDWIRRRNFDPRSADKAVSASTGLPVV